MDSSYMQKLSEQMADIKPTADFSSQSGYFIYIIAAAVFIAAVSVLIFYRKKQKQKNKTSEVENIDFLGEIQKIKNDNNKEVRLKWLDLSDLFKRYLYSKFNIMAFYMSEEELSEELQNISDFSGYKEIGNILKIIQAQKYSDVKSEQKDNFNNCAFYLEQIIKDQISPENRENL